MTKCLKQLVKKTKVLLLPKVVLSKPLGTYLSFTLYMHIISV